jgi:hypothetical protein
MENTLENKIQDLNKKAAFEHKHATKDIESKISSFIYNMSLTKQSVSSAIQHKERKVDLEKMLVRIIKEMKSDFHSLINSLETNQEYARELDTTNAQIQILQNLVDSK